MERRRKERASTLLGPREKSPTEHLGAYSSPPDIVRACSKSLVNPSNRCFRLVLI